MTSHKQADLRMQSASEFSGQSAQIRILLVDDSVSTLEVLQRNLQDQGFTVFSATGVAEALEILETQPLDLLITDLKMPKGSGMDLVKHVRENLMNMEVMLITGYPSISGAIQAVKGGAEEYLVKPFTDKELMAAVNRVLEKLFRRRKVEGEKVSRKSFGIIGDSPQMRKVYGLVEKAAGAEATILVSGESGTGKELVARAIHYSSPRRGAPFVPVNCTAIPENLLESELFGHVKGAFTGANESRAGFFQIADGGSIFLDEIGDATPNLQGKLLRVLQSHEIFMVGSSRVQKVNTRIIAATHKDLPNMVKQGLFREDLFYRLNILEINIPPLRDRGDDIFLLINFFAEKFARENRRPIPRFSDRSLEALKNFEWPGNVRELENVIQRMVIFLDKEKIDTCDLPHGMRHSLGRTKGFNKTLAEVETEHIRNVLNLVRGNKTRAAGILGIDRKTLREKTKSARLKTPIEK